MIVAFTPESSPLYTPMFVRKRPLERPVRSDTACASESFSPGTNIPFVPPPATGEKSRLVTRTELPELVNSTAPAVDGALNAEEIMSSNALDSRGERVKGTCGAVPGHAPRKHRYTAVTETGAVYDVLKTRTSEKNGLAAAPTGNDVTAGSVSVSDKSGGARRRVSAAAAKSRRFRRLFVSMIVISRRECMGGRRDAHSP